MVAENKTMFHVVYLSGGGMDGMKKFLALTFTPAIMALALKGLDADEGSFVSMLKKQSGLSSQRPKTGKPKSHGRLNGKIASSMLAEKEPGVSSVVGKSKKSKSSVLVPAAPVPASKGLDDGFDDQGLIASLLNGSMAQGSSLKRPTTFQDLLDYAAEENNAVPSPAKKPAMNNSAFMPMSAYESLLEKPSSSANTKEASKPSKRTPPKKTVPRPNKKPSVRAEPNLNAKSELTGIDSQHQKLYTKITAVANGVASLSKQLDVITAELQKDSETEHSEKGRGFGSKKAFRNLEASSLL
ncbi:hypothetical protein NEHOM01_1765 [Nematocida homosporus]|uniref:uncharacterized protein n=1 Tax=Nematocida homosporus TaxID=1912981 RepID=UPI00221FB109|nr:uncharacterized protein NEHOM01_1765 [Nematocida homosporus]KAI5186876.1 hypothetical protein NEHOM01_1765 [Nematocida homosporus]